jgi:hypothetical protein
MSVYQNTYFIVPKEGNYTLFEGLNLNSFMEEDGLFEDDLFWENLNYQYKKYENYLINNFEIGESWSKDLKIFGDNDINCLKVFVEDGLIASVSYRINFKTDYSNFLEKVIDFCKLNNFLITDNELNILSLDIETLNNNILKSKAYERFRNIFDDSLD